MPISHTRPSSLLRTALLCAALACTAEPTGGSPASNGKEKFDGSCIQCHRSDAEGMEGMGMDLQHAPLVKTGSVAAIADFIKSGHPPTKEFPLGMPPGGGESLTEQDRTDIAVYLKTLAK